MTPVGFFNPTIPLRTVRSKKQKMSQHKFSETFCIPEDNIKNWEQGRRVPDEAAKILLIVIDRNPQAVIEVLRDNIKQLCLIKEPNSNISS